MALADIVLPIPLQRWAVLMLENQFHWNQLSGAQAPLTMGCDGVYIAPQRAFIADSINNAANQIIEILGFHLRPTYLYQRIPLGSGYPMQLQTLRLPAGGYLQAIGQRATTVIQANAAVTYSDSNADGYDDLATVTVTTTVDATQIQVFFRTGDGAPGAADELWRIEPLTVRKSGNTATITGHMSLFAKPSIWAQPYEAPNFRTPLPFDSNNAANYVTQVDVYRVYPDSTSAVTLIADNFLAQPCSGDDCGDTTATACARIVDARTGQIELRFSSDCGCDPYYFAYQYADVYYYAGLPLDALGNISNRDLEKAVVRLANCLMPRQPCNFCDAPLSMWAYDNDPTTDGSRAFGTPKKGAVETHQIITDYALGKGGKLTMNRR